MILYFLYINDIICSIKWTGGKKMILITGDIHGSNDISKLTNKSNPIFRQMTKEDYVIICGDFGLIWDNSKQDMWWRKWLNERQFTTLFVDGNHENFDLLYEFPQEEWNGGKVHRISESIFHLMRGQVFDINGKKFFTMGGAESHDKEIRKLGKSIWLQELPNDDEYAEALVNLEKCNYKVDYVITHCAPTEIEHEVELVISKKTEYKYSYSKNKLTDFLDDTEKKLQYERWFCGHYHCDYISKLHPKFEILYNKIVRL